MKGIFSIGLLILVMGLMACTSAKSETTKEVGTQDNVYDIELENNRKWTVVKEMMVYIRNIETEIQSTGKTETPDFESLAVKLDSNIELLTSNCTMTGKAHDQLHKWLVPFIGLVEDLSTASNNEEKMTIFQSLEASMVEFNAYFE